MELKSLVNYKNVYAGIKFISLITILCSFFFAAGIFIFSWKQINTAKNTIYVMDASGNVAAATGQVVDMNIRLFEYEDHIEKFYKLWYEFDQHSYQRNIDKALILAGDCGKELYNEYKSQDIKGMLSSKNISINVEIIEIKIDINAKPVVGYIKGIQTIKRLNGQVKRNMNCTFSIYDVNRSRENSHGCKIENWKVVDNTQIEDKQ